MSIDTFGMHFKQSPLKLHAVFMRKIHTRFAGIFDFLYACFAVVHLLMFRALPRWFSLFAFAVDGFLHLFTRSAQQIPKNLSRTSWWYIIGQYKQWSAVVLRPLRPHRYDNVWQITYFQPFFFYSSDPAIETTVQYKCSLCYSSHCVTFFRNNAVWTATQCL